MPTTKKPADIPLWSPKITNKKLDLEFPNRKPGTPNPDSDLIDVDPLLLPTIIKSPRKKVVIICPYATEDLTLKEKHAKYAVKCFEDSIQRQEAPMLNQVFHSHMLAGFSPIQRDIGLITHLNWILVSDYVAVYTDYGLSPGMQTAINVATVRNKKIEYRTIGQRV